MPSITRPIVNRVGTSRLGDGLPDRDMAHDYHRRVGLWLRERRYEAGLTQEALGAELGMGASAISSIEVGRRTVSPEHYAQLARIFNVPEQVFGQFMLRYTNPWVYAMLFPQNQELKAELEDFQKRVSPQKNRPSGN